MYKTSTFLTSLFSKFQVRDKIIRKQLVDLYRPIIESILADAPASKRVIIFKELLPAIQVTISYLEELKTANTCEIIDKSAYQALKTSITFNNYLIKRVGIRSDMPSTFSGIMKQVDLDDIACDIGSCISDLKQTTDDEVREGLSSQLQVLLNDYNLVTGQELTVDDVCRQGALDHEL